MIQLQMKNVQICKANRNIKMDSQERLKDFRRIVGSNQMYLPEFEKIRMINVKRINAR